MPKLGVNIDHIATVREARKTYEPDPVKAAIESLKAGCDSIVCHLRKDRRHINDADLDRLKEAVPTKLNLEMSVDPEIVDIACRVKPEQATIVPENRQEITTEGGLDVVGHLKKTRDVVARLRDAGIQVSLFIDPEKAQVEAAKTAGARIIEFHTGRYAGKFHSKDGPDGELDVLRKMTRLGVAEGLVVCAGHGLNYENTRLVAEINKMQELNIGHSIVSRAVFVGMYEAVSEMVRLIR